MIKTIGNNISYKDTTCSAEAELNQIVNPAHGDCAYVIETQKNYMFDGATLQWVEQKKKESDVTRDEFEDLVDKVDDLQLFKFPNATIVGEPTINNGQISGFSENNYLKFPFLVDFKNKPFTIVMDFTTGANVTNQENIFDSDFGLAFAIRNENFVFAVSSNGTSWNIGEGVGTYTVSPNTTYRVKLAWNGSEYTLAYSLDGGKNYITDITKSGTVQPYPTQIYIGIGEDHAAVLNYFTGIINFNYAELYIDNILVWTGMDDVGLASRLATDVSNIDEAGKAKINDLITTLLSAGVVKHIELTDGFYLDQSGINAVLAYADNSMSLDYDKITILNNQGEASKITLNNGNLKLEGSPDGASNPIIDMGIDISTKKSYIEMEADSVKVNNTDLSTFAKGSDITSAIQALDVASVGGTDKYISAISETDGKIKATATAFPKIPTVTDTYSATSTDAMSGKAVASALGGYLKATKKTASATATSLAVTVDSNSIIILVHATVSGYDNYGVLTRQSSNTWGVLATSSTVFKASQSGNTVTITGQAEIKNIVATVISI